MNIFIWRVHHYLLINGDINCKYRNDMAGSALYSGIKSTTRLYVEGEPYS